MSWYYIIFNLTFIRFGRSTPPLPFAIQCLSMTEATHIMCTLQRMLEPILPEPSTSNLLRVLSSLSMVRTLLGDDQSGFYAVVIGSPTGIHHTRCESIHSVYITITWTMTSRESAINLQGNLAWQKIGQRDLAFHLHENLLDSQTPNGILSLWITIALHLHCVQWDVMLCNPSIVRCSLINILASLPL